jgi:protein-S-isoprenylcysteine O-methyltransferase Ste14
MKIVLQAVASSLIGLALFGLWLFLPAGTFNYWQAWVLLVVAALVTSFPTAYLLRTNPVALERRGHAGPTAETRTVQKVFIIGWYSTLAAITLVSALDRRFAWSPVPTALCLVGDLLVAVGFGVGMLVVIQNSHAAATVRVEADQKLVSSGLYGLVRHPMYTANVFLMVGIPLALGSYWGLVFLIPGLIVLALRIRDEEKLLQEELDGYSEYTQKVRYRLVPCMW